ncbi:hypothetical protein KY290_021746 [Solanum tuberosum]|uniref:DUF262 domain-containing protein n=1 Tax=Solanum tuberosum TaxID=4113 RepID=A0ABQ7V2F4_SOLTU|nr:hypothetical protein KY284_020756 [Solanum tuberosum]KAH0683155.1 hypothetical protein KY289_020907 [Solanum tuberosum]KAH0758253.1 hypothetical protein KY290_021746 [Solanum tuberosum]
MACGRDRGRTTKVIQLLDVKLAKVNKRLLDTEEFNGTVANSEDSQTKIQLVDGRQRLGRTVRSLGNVNDTQLQCRLLPINFKAKALGPQFLGASNFYK